MTTTINSGEQPLISIGLPIYNGANFVREMLDSLLAQTYKNFEVIVTDNASTDETPNIIREYAERDSRVQYHLNENNLGAAGNFNRAFDIGRGKYFKWCAHDDRLSPNFLADCVARLESDAELVMAYGATIDIDDRGAVLPNGAGDEIVDISSDPSERFFFQIAKIGSPCSPIFGVFRRDALARSTLHRPYYSSDRALLAEIATLGNFAFVESAIYYCREHKTRSVNIDDKVARSRWISGTANRFVSAEHLNLARHLFEIAGRHRHVISPWKMRWRLLGYVGRPRQIGRYVMELASLVSPKAVYWLKSKLTFPRGQSAT